MAFPASWPPRPASATRTLRFYVAGTSTANFSDNAFIFREGTGADTYAKTPKIKAGSNDQADYGSAAVSGSPAGASSFDPNVVKAQIPATMIQVYNLGGTDLEISFDGTNIHGIVPGGKDVLWAYRCEAGIAVRGAGLGFRIEAW